MKTLKCPICGWQNSPYTSASRMNGEIQHHITAKARNELWAKEFKKELKTPHLNYFRSKKAKVEIIYKVNFEL